MSIKIIFKQENYDEAMVESDSRLVLVDFHAQWCGPCKMMEPIVKRYAEEFSDGMSVYKCNVDDCVEISSAANVSCMPTFQFYKNRQKVGELLGANQDKLKELIEKYTNSRL